MSSTSLYDKMNSGWTDERVATLRKMWLEGLSASQIADELQNGITRNAVIGKIHRLGLSAKGRPKPGALKQVSPAPPPRAPSPAPPPPALPKVPPLRAFNSHPADRRPGKDDITEEERRSLIARVDVVIPTSERVTIMELRETMCRWPLGDPASPDFRYCGADAPIGEGPYCNDHRRIAYVASRPRKPMSDERKEAIRRGIARSSFGRTLANG